MKVSLCSLFVMVVWQSMLVGQQFDIEAKPISYSATPDDNPVSKLVSQLKTKLSHLFANI